MRPIFRTVTLVAVLALAGAIGWGVRSFAAEQTWIGVLTDATCGKSHLKMAQGQFTDKECTNACAEMVHYAIVSDGKVIELANKLPELKDLGGEKIKVTGELNSGGLIVAAKVEQVKE